MKFLEHRFYRGPNVRAKMSGLWVACGEIADAPGQEFDPDELRLFLAELAGIVPITTESVLLSSPDYLRSCPNAALGLVLAVYEVVTRDFWITPATGEVLTLDEDHGTLFMPCDEQALGVAGVRFALLVANAAPGFRAGELARVREQIAANYKSMRVRSRNTWIDQSTLMIVRRAAARGIPYSRLSEPGRFMQLGQGVHGCRILETASDNLSLVGSQIASDKFATGSLLARAGLPTPFTHWVNTVPQALEVAKRLGFPLVLKPRFGGKGGGVTVDIRSEEELRRAIERASAYRKGLVVERFVQGDDHRALVVGGRLVAVARRLPAQVIGDGNSTVAELVERHNRDPRCSTFAFERLFEPIELDGEAHEWLARTGLRLESVPAAGASVRLRGAANISRGGSADDLTDIIHPDNRKALERAARIVGVDVAGVDFLSPDISRSWREVPSAILELNSLPGLRPHLIADPRRDVTGPIVSLMFPAGADGRVPTVGITGSLGKTTTTAMTAAILAEAGLKVAMATTQGTRIDGEQVRVGDLAGGGVASQLLQDPLVEAGVFELARGGLVKSGLGLDRVDVGVVLGVLDNHLGLDGAETRQDLARIKRLVIENARKLALLNADDPECLAMLSHAAAPRIGLVSAREDNPEALRHRDAGGLAAWIDTSDDLVFFDAGDEIGRIPLRTLPDCWGGSFRPAAINAMFAGCACHALGTDFAVIARALTTFKSDLLSNPGRNNYFENLPYRLFLSPADGPEVTREVAKLIRGIEVKGQKRLLITAAGDRPDDFIRDMARAAAGAFTDYFCTDWTDLRGRRAGEVCELLAGALRDAGVEPENIHAIPRFDQAIAATYAGLGPDDLVLDTFTSSVGQPHWLAARSLKLVEGGFAPA